MDDKQYTEELAKNIGEKLRGKQTALKFDNTPTEGSVNPVTSEGIKEYVDTSLSKPLYTAGDNISIDENRVISATDTTYAAGEGIDITGNKITFEGIDIFENYSPDGIIKQGNGNGLSAVNPKYIGTDNENNIYYSESVNNYNKQYILNKTTSTGNHTSGKGLIAFSGDNIGTDGENIYYSKGNDQYVLDKETSTWNTKPGNNFTNLYGEYIGSDGEKIYYSEGSGRQYVLDKETSTWKTKTGSGVTDLYANHIGLDDTAENKIIYYSNGSRQQYVLDKENNIGSSKTGKNLTTLSGEYIGTDGTNIYYSSGSNQQYVLNTETSYGNRNTLTSFRNIYGTGIGKDKDNIYHYMSGNSYILKRNSYKTSILNKIAKTGDYNDLKNKPYIPEELIVSGESKGKYGTSLSINDEKKEFLNGCNVFNSEKLGKKGFKTTNLAEMNLPAIYIGTDGENVYYSRNYSNEPALNHQLIFDPETGNGYNKNGIYPSSGTVTRINNGRDIGTDGENIYYSDVNFHYILDKATSTWSNKTWNGLNSFNGKYVGTDGENIYYSYSSYHYVLDKETSTGNVKTWNGLTSFNGDNIGKDGDNIYYSSSSYQYVLDKATSNGNVKTGNNFTNLYGNYIGSDGDTIYYSYAFDHYVLDKETSTGIVKIGKGGECFYGSEIGKQGSNIYGNNYKLDKGTSTWIAQTTRGELSMNQYNIGTDGENIYYSNQYILDKETLTGYRKTGSQDLELSTSYIGTDGENTYYSNYSKQYVLDKETSTWLPKTGLGAISNPVGAGIGTDEENIYYVYNNNHYVLDKETSTGNVKTWNGLPSYDFTFSVPNMGKSNGNIYYSDYKETTGTVTSYQYVLDKDTSTGKAVNGSNINNKLYGCYIGTTKDDVYYSGGEAQGILDKDTNTWKSVNGGIVDENIETKINLRGDEIGTQGDNVYYSLSSKTYQLAPKTTLETYLSKVALTGNYNDLIGKIVINPESNSFSLYEKELLGLKVGNTKYEIKKLQCKQDKFSNTFIPKTGTGLENFNGSDIGTDGENAYYSNGLRQYVLDKETSTGNVKTGSGVNELYGHYIGTDGENIYQSRGYTTSTRYHYVLDKETLTWRVKNGNGTSTFNGDNIGKDGNKIYGSNNGGDYELDIPTSTGVKKNGVNQQYSLDGNRIGTDGENIYYSGENGQFILDRDTDTWNPKTGIGLTNPYATYIGTNGENIYHSRNGSNYILDKETSTGTEIRFKNFNNIRSGENIGLIDDNVYYSYYSTPSVHYMLEHLYEDVDLVEKVAVTGSYNDLKDKPVIPDSVSGTNDGTNGTSLTIGNDTYGLGSGSSTGVQSDGNQEDSTQPDYIKNKPVIPDLSNLFKIDDQGNVYINKGFKDVYTLAETFDETKTYYESYIPLDPTKLAGTWIPDTTKYAGDVLGVSINFNEGEAMLANSSANFLTYINYIDPYNKSSIMNYMYLYYYDGQGTKQTNAQPMVLANNWNMTGISFTIENSTMFNLMTNFFTKVSERTVNEELLTVADIQAYDIAHPSYREIELTAETFIPNTYYTYESVPDGVNLKDIFN